jgi:phenylacetate-CoA ligase
MRIDFSGTELVNSAFSVKPMTFCDSKAKNVLVAVLDLLAIETGSRAACEAWQHAQLRNLLSHSAQRSTFWRKRIGAKKPKYVALQSLPVLSRKELIQQVEGEGCLLRMEDGIGVQKHATSGSTGAPTQFFVSTMNVEYNNVRNIAQYFIEGRDLTKNKTLLKHSPDLPANQIGSKKIGCWLAPMDALFKSGETRVVEYFRQNIEALCKELSREPIGYLVSSPRIVETLLQHVDADFFTKAGAHMWIPMGEAVDARLRETLSSKGIAVRSTYSAEEAGLIGSECEKNPGVFHVATSNVFVEVDNSDCVRFEDKTLGRVLVTHLHSYATPIVRYDIGDFASLENRCCCGHDGPTLSNVYGKMKSLIKYPDGRVAPFYIRDAELQSIARFSEYRIRQTDLNTIVVELCCPDKLSDQLYFVEELIRKHCGNEFKVVVNVVDSIDWGGNRKRLGYRSDVV